MCEIDLDALEIDLDMVEIELDASLCILIQTVLDTLI